MKVICKYDKLNQINDTSIIERLRRNINLSGEDELGVTIGIEYMVYGVVFWDNAPWFYLCESEQDDYPTPFPADLFDILDSSIPKQWHLTFTCIDGLPVSKLVFSEWANDPLFFERLVDGSKRELDIFKKYKAISS